MSIQIRTMFDRRRVKAPTPSGVAIVYLEQMKNDGTMDLVRSGKHDLNAFVQASKDSTLIYNLIDRFERTQDSSIFDQRHGFYADVGQMPRSLAEAQNMMISIDKKFCSLSADVKAEFGNSSQRFAQAVIDGSVSTVLNSIEKKKAEKIKKAEKTKMVEKKEGEVIES